MSEIFSNWNVDAYYDDTESDEHWQLRRSFMEVHKNKYPEDYLVALAKTFVNIEHLGCAYSPALMNRIAELSKDVMKQYRQRKYFKLRRKRILGSNTPGQK